MSNVERRGYDVEINSVKYRFRRGEGVTGMRHQKVRSQVELQEITGIAGQRLQSRADLRPFMQTDWAGGSRWEKPLLGGEQDNVYVSASNMSAWRRPGFLEPLNLVHEVSDSNITAGPFSSNGTKTIVPGTTQLETALKDDVYEWDDATEAFTRIVGTDMNLDVTVKSLAYDAESQEFFLFGGDGVSTLIGGFDLAGGSTAGSSNVGETTTTAYGDLVVHDGDVFFWDRKKVYRVYEDGGAYSEEVIANDGMGLSAYGGLSSAYHRALISTSEGLFYIKNVLQDGLPTPWIYRIERDATGTYISTAIATLPTGLIAFDIFWHLGSVLIACTGETRRLHGNLSLYDAANVYIFHVTNSNTGAIGSPLGDRGPLDDQPGYFLGSEREGVWIGGHKQVWYYDAVQGGLHPAYTYSGPTFAQPIRHMAQEEDSDDDGIYIFGGAAEYMWVKGSGGVEYDTVASFGDDTDHYTLESAYFDFGLPFEDKRIVSVDIDTEQLSANEQWTLFVEADDAGSWTQVAAHTNVDHASYTLGAPITGKRFRYKLAYETKAGSTRAGAFRGLKINAVSGDITDAWVIELDGTESLNLENEVTDPTDIYDNLASLGDTLALFTFKYYKPDSDTEVEVTARVAGVEFEHDSEGEFYARATIVGSA